VIRALRPWVPALLCMAAIFVASAQHRVSLPDFDESDKVSHLAAYSVLGAALAYGGAQAGIGPLPLMLFGSLYGASDEFHQSFVPGRSPDLRDWLADTAGVILGVLALHRFFSRRARAAAPPGADPLRR
jgi:hypothetical protein